MFKILRTTDVAFEIRSSQHSSSLRQSVILTKTTENKYELSCETLILVFSYFYQIDTYQITNRYNIEECNINCL